MPYLEHMKKYRNKKLERQEYHGKILFEKFLKYMSNKYLLVIRPSWNNQYVYSYKYDFKEDGAYLFSSRTGFDWKQVEGRIFRVNPHWTHPTHQHIYLSPPPEHTKIHLRGLSIDIERFFHSYRKYGIFDIGIKNAECFVFDTEEERDLFYEVNYVF